MRRQVVGLRMRAAADENGLTVREVAQRLHVAATTVHRWYSGERRPDDQHVERFSRLVDRSPDDFYEEIPAGAIEFAQEMLARVIDDVYRGAQIVAAAERHVPGALALTTRRQARGAERAFFAKWDELARARYGRGWADLTGEEKVRVVEAYVPAAGE